MLEVSNAKQKSSGSLGAAFDGKIDSPKLGSSHLEMPAFNLPKMEVPAAFRELAEKGLSQARESFDKLKIAAEEANELFESTCVTASKGATEYGLKLIAATRVNTNAAFDFTAELMGAKSLSEMIELSNTHARKQFEILARQTKELATLAQKVGTETSEPIRAGVNKVLSKAR